MARLDSKICETRGLAEHLLNLFRRPTFYLDDPET